MKADKQELSNYYYEQYLIEYLGLNADLAKEWLQKHRDAERDLRLNGVV